MCLSGWSTLGTGVDAGNARKRKRDQQRNTRGKEVKRRIGKCPQSPTGSAKNKTWGDSMTSRLGKRPQHKNRRQRKATKQDMKNKRSQTDQKLRKVWNTTIEKVSSESSLTRGAGLWHTLIFWGPDWSKKEIGPLQELLLKKQFFYSLAFQTRWDLFIFGVLIWSQTTVCRLQYRPLVTDYYRSVGLD